jgi:hypothetical protein
LAGCHYHLARISESWPSSSAIPLISGLTRPSKAGAIAIGLRDFARSEWLLLADSVEKVGFSARLNSGATNLLTTLSGFFQSFVDLYCFVIGLI